MDVCSICDLGPGGRWPLGGLRYSLHTSRIVSTLQPRVGSRSTAIRHSVKPSASEPVAFAIHHAFLKGEHRSWITHEEMLCRGLLEERSPRARRTDALHDARSS